MVKFFCEDIDFSLKEKLNVRRWLKFVAESEVKRLGDVSVIFCSDNYILDINMRYLQHDYFTDIITFNYNDGDVLSGDLFISIDSVKENSSIYSTEFIDELHRVIVHGLLHLIGYDDHTPEDQRLMREKEDYYLDQRTFNI